MTWARAWAPAGLGLAMTAIAACQLVSGIGDLNIVDDAGDAHANDATMEASGQSDAPGDSTSDSTVEAAPDGTADTQVETASDSPTGMDGGPDATADAEAGTDATVDSSANDASDAGDASDASDASDGPVEAGCQFGWQCPTGYCVTGVCIEPRSCEGLPRTCGPAQNEDCCQSLLIPTLIPAGDAGVQYDRSYDLPNYTDASFPATLAGPFALDEFEVTVERFGRFLVAYAGPSVPPGAGAYPPVPGTGWDSSWNANLPASQAALLSQVTAGGGCLQPFAPPSGMNPMYPNAPMNCIEWYVAFAFCAWDGSRLPTEAEWNYAAAGGAAQREYPWSVGPPQIDSTFAWYACGGPGGTMEPDGSAGPCPMPPPPPLFVGTESPLGNARWGHADMAGSMTEPTLDFFGPYPLPCRNCVNTSGTAGAQRVYRGGSFIDPPSLLDTGSRQSVGPAYNGANLGIRCAR